jgi:hypothetical protein
MEALPPGDVHAPGAEPARDRPALAAHQARTTNGPVSHEVLRRGTAAGTATPPTPTPLTGDALAKAYLASWDAWNAGDKAAFRATYADDAISHWPDSPIPERKGGDVIAEQAMGFRAGFPDAKAAAQLVLVNGRTVTGVWLTTGTNSAAMKTPMGEVPATNKKMGVLLFHSVSYNDANKVSEDWFLMDSNTMASQLGMSPMPAGR